MTATAELLLRILYSCQGHFRYLNGQSLHGHAFMPAVVSTSGRIYGELLWVPYVLADIQRFSGILASRDFSNEAFRWIRV